MHGSRRCSGCAERSRASTGSPGPHPNPDPSVTTLTLTLTLTRDRLAGLLATTCAAAAAAVAPHVAELLASVLPLPSLPAVQAAGGGGGGGGAPAWVESLFDALVGCGGAQLRQRRGARDLP